MLPRLDKPIAGVELPHFVVALLVDQILRLLILALVILDSHFRRVFIHDIRELYGRKGCESIRGKGEINGLVTMVNRELPT